MNLILLIAVNLMIGAEPDTERLFVQTWNALDGLDHAPIEALYMDDMGLLWVGTRWGLKCFNGLTTTANESLPLGPVSAIQGHATTLWAWIEGLGLYVREAQGDFQPMDSPLNTALPVKLFYAQGSLWILQADQVYFYKQGWTKLPLSTPPKKGSTGRDGLWLLTPDSLLWVQDNQVIPHAGDFSSVQTILASKTGDVWIGQGSQLSVFRPSNKSRVTHANLPGQIRELAMQNGWIWVNHSKGLARFDPNLGQLIHVQPMMLTLDDEPIKGLTASGDNLFWGKGNQLVFFHPSFGNYLFDSFPPRGLDHLITCLIHDTEDRLVLGLSSGVMVSGTPPQLFKLPSESLHVTTIHAQPGVLWLGLNQGLMRLDAGKPVPVRVLLPEPLNNAKINVIKSKGDSLLIGSDKGGLCYMPNLASTQGTIYRESAVYDVMATPSGRLLAATENGLMDIVEQGPWLPVEAPELMPVTHRINRLLQDRQGHIWLGTNNGLLALNEHSLALEFKAFGLPHQTVTDLVEDASGSLWATTPCGIARINGQTGRAFQVAPWMLPFQHLSATSKSDTISFANQHHIMSLEPGRFSMDCLPTLQLERVSWRGKDSLQQNNVSVLKLKENHSNLQVNLLLGNLFATGKPNIQWRIRPGDPWSPLVDSTISFGRLNPDHYQLEVRANYPDGLHGPIHQLMDLTVQSKPAYWGFSIPPLLVLFLFLVRRRKTRAAPIGQDIPIEVSPLTYAIPARNKAVAPVILVVDDDPMNLSVVSDLLSDQPYTLISASNGADALDLCKAGPYDLVLLDVMMPGLSGFEVCRRLRLNYSLQELPIIFLTARATKEDLVRGFEAGGNDYLPKPIMGEELKVRIRTHLQIKELHRLLQQEAAFLATQIELEHQKRLAQEASLRLLHVQMNPHFLQNALNTVSWFCISNPNGAREMLDLISGFLRETYNATPKSACPLKDELKRIDLFCQIQVLRFGDRLRVQYDIHPDARNLLMPNFMIQPLVENAILHGVEHSSTCKEVILSCSIKHNLLSVSVSNEGDPLPKPFHALLDERHALGNIAKRLEILFQTQLTHTYEDRLHTFGFQLTIDTLKPSEQLIHAESS